MSKRTKQTAKKRKEKTKRKQQRFEKLQSKKQKTHLLDANEINISELETIIERSGKTPLNEQDRELLLSVSKTLQFVTEQLEKKSISIGRLRKLLFGASTETLKNLETASAEDTADTKQESLQKSKPETSQPKPNGHGRNGADAYTGAKKINIAHEHLKPGDPCPDCLKGTIYETTKPGRVVRVSGQAPLKANVYELQKLRCNLCGKIYTAKAPKEVGPQKYDAKAISMIALLKYGTGVPFKRLQGLQGSLGIPLSASTQWDIVSQHEDAFVEVYQSLIKTAAQGKVIHNDDTVMKILNRTDLKPPANSDRKGIFTSGIVSVDDDHQIALFFTGHQHAGENLADVLKHRALELDAPIQMSDGLSRNVPGEFKTLLANCLAHGRRKFVDIYDAFPSECHHVLDVLSKVYQHESQVQAEQLTDAQRLAYHQQYSGPLMSDLKDWMTEQLDEHLIEPNSSLGQALRYMIKHWDKLTLFLHQPGVPLDNNLCERALKKAILHRKNAYFYKTANGARVGDMFMSLIHTCELNGVNPFDYLTAIQEHSDASSTNPSAWLPWNYQTALPQLAKADD